MFRETATVLLAVISSTACLPPRDLPRENPRRIPPMAAAEQTDESHASPCVRVWGEARLRSYAYDHVVHLESACHRTASCNVSTNVNPELVIVAVEPGQALEVITRRGSENPDFTPIVHCSIGTR